MSSARSMEVTFLLSTCVHTSSLSLIGGTCAPLPVYFLTFYMRAHLLSLFYRGHLCTFVCLLSYFLTFLLTCVHTSSLSLIGGTCAPLSVYFLTFFYFLTFYMRAHLLSLSYRGHLCTVVLDALEFASADLQATPDIVLAADTSRGLALMHASADLRATHDIVLAAVTVKSDRGHRLLPRPSASIAWFEATATPPSRYSRASPDFPLE